MDEWIFESATHKLANYPKPELSLVFLVHVRFFRAANKTCRREHAWLWHINKQSRIKEVLFSRVFLENECL